MPGDDKNDENAKDFHITNKSTSWQPEKCFHTNSTNYQDSITFFET